MKHSAVWMALGLLLTSIATTIGLRDDPQKWRYQFSLVATILFSVIFLAGLIFLLRNLKKK